METSDYDLYDRLRPHLMTGEQLLWYGQPSKQKHMRGRSIFYVLFLIFWLGFAVFWTVTATAAAGLFGLFGLPFIGIGVYMAVTLFRASHDIVYALTDSRILILNVKTSTAIPLSSLYSVNRHFRSDGTGDIMFGNPYENSYYDYSRRCRSRAGFTANGFFNIDDAENVARKIDEQLRTVREAK